jgi:hypothetical protein
MSSVVIEAPGRFLSILVGFDVGVLDLFLGLATD